jgi:DtxR family Mn-dependent transcriptional regulator
MVMTESLENYLRVVYEIQSEKGVARVKDLAMRLSVKTSSAVEAVKKLLDKGLVEHEKYGYIRLTQKGVIEARRVYQNHRMLFQFFHEVLSIDEKESEELACGVEHHVTKNFYERLDKLLKFFQENRDILEKFQEFSKKEVSEMNATLDKFRPGDVLKVDRINGDLGIKQRLARMGIVPGVELEVERIAPLGDPIEVRVEGTRVSVRKKDAKSIVVEKKR